jgi:probable HAF family extracellular repeat protein
MRHIHGVALATLCVLLGAPSAWAEPRFHAYDLGPSWVGGFGSALNDRGDVAGTLIDPASGVAHAAVRGARKTTDLGAGLGADNGALGISDLGLVVGYGPASPRHAPTVDRPMAYSMPSGRLRLLGDATSNFGTARGVNRAGQIVGEASFADGAIHAFQSEGALMQDLGTLPGGHESQANAINASGQATGWSDVGDGTGGRAVVWAQGRMTALGALVAGGASEGRAINDQGVVVGDAAIAAEPGAAVHAFVSTPTGLADLGTLAGARASHASVAHGINNAGRIVGASTTAAAAGRALHAFYVDAGGMHDLNAMLDADTGDTLIEAVAINDHDQIVCNSASGRVYLLTPVAQ